MPKPTPQDYRSAAQSFLEDISILEETPDVGKRNRRRILDSSAALRRIFVENVLGRANSEAGLKFVFKARKCHEPKTVMPPTHVLRAANRTYDEHLAEMTFFQAEALDPLEPDNPHWPAQTLQLSRDAWMASRVGWVLGEPITVRDNIKYVANIAGGVHAPVAKSRQEKWLRDLDSIDHEVPTGSGIRQLVYIARISARGLAPLRDYLIEAGH